MPATCHPPETATAGTPFTTGTVRVGAPSDTG